MPLTTSTPEVLGARERERRKQIEARTRPTLHHQFCPVGAELNGMVLHRARLPQMGLLP